MYRGCNSRGVFSFHKMEMDKHDLEVLVQFQIVERRSLELSKLFLRSKTPRIVTMM